MTVDLSGDNEGFVLCFVTVLENPGHGYSGGLLMLNSLGRPLEFHATDHPPRLCREEVPAHDIDGELGGVRVIPQTTAKMPLDFESVGL